MAVYTSLLRWIARPKPDPSVPPEQLLLEFHRALALVVSEEPLRSLAVAKMQEWLESDRLLLYVREGRSGRFHLAASAGLESKPSTGSRSSEPSEPARSSAPLAPDLPGDSRLAEWLERNEVPMLLTEHKGVLDHFTTEERDLIERFALTLCLPLVSLQRIHGFLLAGGVRHRRPQDLCENPWTRILLTQVGLALEHASLVKSQQERLRQMYWADRLAIAGQIAAGAAHEIRNPLTTVRSTVQHLAKRIEDEDYRRSLQELLSEVDRIDSIVEGLLSFARPSREAVKPFALDDELNLVLDLVAAQARKAHVGIEKIAFQPGVWMLGDSSRIRQVFLNLAMNAIQAMPKGGTLTVSMEIHLEDDRRRAVVTFRDTGTGIDPEHMDSIFDPFFTTRSDGTGLGLSISYGIVSSHGGTITASSTPGEGTIMVVELPLEPSGGEQTDG
jgi:signal transduction histidine kinase